MFKNLKLFSPMYTLAVSSKRPINLILFRAEAIMENKTLQSKQNDKRKMDSLQFTEQVCFYDEGETFILMKMKVAPKVSLIKKRRGSFLFI